MEDGIFDADIFDEDGALTAAFLLARGYCCGNGCRNCPYEPRHGGLEASPPDHAPPEKASSNPTA